MTTRTTRDAYTDLSIKALKNVKLALEDAGYQVDLLPLDWETKTHIDCSLQVKERGQHVATVELQRARGWMFISRVNQVRMSIKLNRAHQPSYVLDSSPKGHFTWGVRRNLSNVATIVKLCKEYARHVDSYEAEEKELRAKIKKQSSSLSMMLDSRNRKAARVMDKLLDFAVKHNEELRATLTTEDEKLAYDSLIEKHEDKAIQYQRQVIQNLNDDVRALRDAAHAVCAGSK